MTDGSTEIERYQSTGSLRRLNRTGARMRSRMILGPSGALSFANALRPPREERRGANTLRLVLEGETARRLRVLQLVNRGKVAIDERGIGERPQVLSRLKFGGIGWQEEHVEVLRNLKHETGVPASPIQHEHNLLGRTRADGAGERRSLHREERDRDGGRQMKDGPPRSGMNKAHQIAPCIAVLHRSHRPLPAWRPHTAQDRLEADAVFVGRPDFDCGLRESLRYAAQERAEVFLKAACACGSAWVWRGRGTCGL
jgi:hypothetical protein